MEAIRALECMYDQFFRCCTSGPGRRIFDMSPGGREGQRGGSSVFDQDHITTTGN
jgi:hypothetical protein